jgi:hypothetical protein
MGVRSLRRIYVFVAFLHFAHRARAVALIRARPAAEICRLSLALLGDVVFEPPFCFAYLARCAAAIRLRAAADMRPVRVLEEVLPSVVKALMAASRRSRSCWSSSTTPKRLSIGH